MGRSAGISSRAKAGSLAVLMPLLALSACANQNDVMAERLAAAEAAAGKAVSAQQAAEKAASAATAAARQVPVAQATEVVEPELSALERDPDGDGSDAGREGHDDDMPTFGDAAVSSGSSMPGPT